MNKSKHEMVKSWMEKFGQECPEKSQVPNVDIRYLRYKLIKEELEELGGALLMQDLVKTADAIADLLYVVYGTAVACGISDEQLDEIFLAVHKANLGKFWTKEELVKYPELHGVRLQEEQLNLFSEERALVVTNSNGKVIKPPSFVGPEKTIEKILGPTPSLA